MNAAAPYGAAAFLFPIRGSAHRCFRVDDQYIIEMKIWHGKEYNERGEKQLAEYLDYYHISKGYMLSFNFNQNKQVGTHTINIGDKTLFEAIV